MRATFSLLVQWTTTAYWPAFSSRGPAADGRVKPDVSAVGLGTIGLDVGGENVGPINGTSSPGHWWRALARACGSCTATGPRTTWTRIRKSASQYTHPDNDLGYGIPDFWRAHLLSVAVTDPTLDTHRAERDARSLCGFLGHSSFSQLKFDGPEDVRRVRKTRLVHFLGTGVGNVWPCASRTTCSRICARACTLWMCA